MKRLALIIPPGLAVGIAWFALHSREPVTAPVSAPAVNAGEVSSVKAGQAAISRPPLNQRYLRREILTPVESNDPQVVPDPAAELRDWIARDPHAAVEWAVQQPASEHRYEVLVAACYEIANVNPAEAVALAEEYALTNHATLANVTQQWASHDLSAAHTWVLAKPAGEERNKLAARVGFVWSATQPAAAAEFVVREIPPGSAQTEAAISILHQWALRDFDGAKAWVELFPAGEIRQRAINELNGIRDYSLAVVSRVSLPGESLRTR